MNKYFIKGGRNGGSEVHNELLNKSADEQNNIGSRQISSSQQDRRNMGSGNHENFNNLSGTNFNQGNQGHHHSSNNQSNNNITTNNVKVNSFLNNKSPPGMNVLNNCEQRKNLNDKIMNKYKKTGLLGKFLIKTNKKQALGEKLTNVETTTTQV